MQTPQFRLPCLSGTTNNDGTVATPITLTVGPDIAFEFNGNDVIAGGNGDDTIIAVQNNDTIFGSGGDGFLYELWRVGQ